MRRCPLSSRRRILTALPLVAAALLTSGGCGGPSDRHTDDLPGIRERGVLRVLVEVDDETYLPRSGDPLLVERDLARAFAARQGLEIRFVFVETFSELLPGLRKGRGDLVAANLTVTEERQRRHAFTRPIDESHEVLVLPADRPAPDDLEGLRGRIGVREGTSFVATARRLAEEGDGLELVVLEQAISNEAVLDSVARGALDFTIQDSNRLEILLGYRQGIQEGPVITAARPLAWAVRRGNPELRRALDEFLHEMHLLGPEEDLYRADLPTLREKGRIRMITRNNAATYFLWRGRLLGFEYELGRKLAEELGLRLEVVVAPSHDRLLPMLLEGRGDFVAAFLVPTETRREEGVVFSRPYHYASEVVVGRSSERPLEGLEGLAGRRLVVRPTSSYWTHLERLREEKGVDFEIVAAPSDMETETILTRVAEGDFDLTVADSHLLELEMTHRDDLQGLLALGERRPHAWALRPDSPRLKAAIDDFLADQYRGVFYNMRYAKYFERAEHLEETREITRGDGVLSPYDELVRELAPRYDLDWRLVIAQMYQESRFDPEAESWAGAQGLMQVLPRTARELGIDDLRDPRLGIEAGLRYLQWVRERFPERLDPAERMWFSLAGYNAGHGHVRDARRLARRLGRDPDRWFGHVEQAMLALSEPRWANQARHGYVRGQEPVDYVRSIRDRYRAYVDLLQSRDRRP